MKYALLERLCCPACKGKLVPKPFTLKEKNESDDNDIDEGILLCSSCKIWFPVFSYVPVMLLFKTTFHQEFHNRYKEELKMFSDYRMPDAEPKPGELFVQETFTDEWDIMDLDESELSFTYTREELVDLNRKVWLKWTDTSSDSIKSVLNVGCGLGIETIALEKAIQTADMYAIDLNLALLKSGRALKAKKNIHVIVSSLFDLPFKNNTFDLVYSQGVIHHTYSTYHAFQSISSYVKLGGHLFIWIYGLDDHLIPIGLIGVIAQLKNTFETVFRPVISRLPRKNRNWFFTILSILTHPLVLLRVRHKQKWSLENTNHGIRDWLSPRYAHRHSFNEVMEWFESNEFVIIDTQSPVAYRNLFNKQLYGVGMTGRNVKFDDQS